LQDLNILFGFIDEKNERFSLALIIVFARQSLVLSCNPQKYERDLIISAFDQIFPFGREDMLKSIKDMLKSII